MFKSILITIFLFILLIACTGRIAFAATPTPTSTSTTKVATPTSEIDKKVKILKEKIATKVAELQKENKKAFAGEITKIGKDGFDLKTRKDDNYKVTVDDVATKIFSLSASEKKNIKFEDLEKGNFVVVSGTIIDNTINATSVYKDEEYIVGSGKITEINKSEFSVKVDTTDKNEFILDIETSTKQQLLDTASLRFGSYGFSKLKVGDVIHFVAKKSSDPKKTRISSSRIFIIPQESFIKK